MKKKTKLVLNVLKLKSKALGFSKDELEGIAADIANNFELEEDASEEDINAEVEKQVDAVIPFLKIAQKTAQRTIQNFKDSNDDNDDIEDSDDTGIKKHNHKTKEEEEETEEKVPAWAQALITQNKALQTEILGLKAERETDGRRTKLKALLKDKGTFGKSVLKSFDRMKFENETEFDDFYDGVVEDLAAINQERANEGLRKLGAPTSPEHKGEEKPEVLKDKEIDELADTL